MNIRIFYRVRKREIRMSFDLTIEQHTISDTIFDDEDIVVAREKAKAFFKKISKGKQTLMAKFPNGTGQLEIPLVIVEVHLMLGANGEADALVLVGMDEEAAADARAAEILVLAKLKPESYHLIW